MDRRDVLLWIAVAVGPLMWFLDLATSFVLEPESGEPWRPGWMHALTVVALVLVALTGVVSFVLLRSLRKRELVEGRVRSRRAFLAVAAIALSLVSGLLVLGTAVPKWIVDPEVHP